MINSINTHTYSLQQINKNKPITAATTNDSQKSNNINSRVSTQSINTKNDFNSFINTATPEELDNKLKSIKQSKPPTAMFSLNKIMNSENSFEVAGRINRATAQFEPEAKIFHQQQLELIKQGELEDKTSKEILTDISSLYDEQSDLFKLSMHWGDKGLADSESYPALVKLTPTYADYYA